MRIIRNRGGGDILDNQVWATVNAAYKHLYPSGDFSMPAVQIGGVGLRDRFYLARVNLGYGTFSVQPLRQIDILWEELEVMFRNQPDQVWRASYSVSDVWDFGYGVMDRAGQNAEADILWGKSGSSIEATAALLERGRHMLDAAVQSACLAAELAMKGTLAWLGVDEPTRRTFSHGLSSLVAEIIRLRPSKSDDRFARAAANMPNYVRTRYDEHGLTRVQIGELAMRSQYLAAEAVRRVSDRNLAGTLEDDPNHAPRVFP